MEYTADNLYGPYREKRLVLPQSGPAGFFPTANGQWKAVVSKK